MVSMKPYSTDLRERTIASVESGEYTISEAADRFDVSIPSVVRWLARQRATGSCAPLPPAGGPDRVLAAAEAVIRAAVKAQPDATLVELCAVVQTQLHCTADASMMCRELARLKLTQKKITPCQSTRHTTGQAPSGSLQETRRDAGRKAFQVFG